MDLALAQASATIVNELGLHARPAAELVKLATSFSADISVGKEEMWVSAKSIIGVMTLAAERGSEVTIRAEGDDAEEAVAALKDLVGRGFEE